MNNTSTTCCNTEQILSIYLFLFILAVIAIIISYFCKKNNKNIEHVTYEPIL